MAEQDRKVVAEQDRNMFVRLQEANISPSSELGQFLLTKYVEKGGIQKTLNPLELLIPTGAGAGFLSKFGASRFPTIAGSKAYLAPTLLGRLRQAFGRIPTGMALNAERRVAEKAAKRAARSGELAKFVDASKAEFDDIGVALRKYFQSKGK